MIDPSVRLRRAIYLKDAALLRRILNTNPGLLENPDFEEKSNTSLHTAAKDGLLEIAVRSYSATSRAYLMLTDI